MTIRILLAAMASLTPQVAWGDELRVSRLVYERVGGALDACVDEPVFRAAVEEGLGFSPWSENPFLHESRNRAGRVLDGRGMRSSVHDGGDPTARRNDSLPLEGDRAKSHLRGAGGCRVQGVPGANGAGRVRHHGAPRGDVRPSLRRMPARDRALHQEEHLQRRDLPLTRFDRGFAGVSC